MPTKYLTLAAPSFYQSLDFRTKLALMLALTVLAVLWQDLWYILVLTVVVLFLCFQAGISRGYLWLILQTMSPFIVLLIITHGLFNVENLERTLGTSNLTPLLSAPREWPLVGGLVLSKEGTLYGLQMGLKTIVFILVIPLAVFTTNVDHMIVSLVRLRLPYKLALIFTATLRFYPTLLEDIRLIREGLYLRGIRNQRVSLLRRAVVYAKIVVPLILNAMFKSQQVELALQARGLNARRERTYLHNVNLSPADYTIISFCGLVCGLGPLLFYTAGFGRTWRF
jgi:energy-coupling factor transport system permease protein